MCRGEAGWRSRVFGGPLQKRRPNIMGRYHSGGCVAVLSVAALLAATTHPAAAAEEKAANAENPGWVLAHHSFERTLTYDDRLGDWTASASTMALRDRLQILPPVADRYGLFWNKRAASTSNFEISFNFRAMPQKKDDSVEDGVFAFWLSPDNFTAGYNEQAVVTVRNWTKGLEDAGLTFINNRPNFKGLGVLFLGGAERPFVSAILNDGSSEKKLSDFPPKSDDPQTKYIDWRQKDVEVKIRVVLGSDMVGTIRVGGASATPVEIFRIAAQDSKSWTDSYLGFSGYSGSKSFLELDMSRVEFRNFDQKTLGEKQDSAEEDELGDVDGWKQVLEAEKKLIDQKSQKEAVERLTKLLGNYVERYNKMGEKVQSELVWLEKRMSMLDAEVSKVVVESKVVNPETGAIDTAALKEHISGIKTIIHTDKAAHNLKFEAVHQVAKTLKEKGGDVLGREGRAKVASVAEQAKTLEQHVSSGSTQTNTLLFILVLAVCVLGLLFLNRMRYYEKKHYI